MTADLAYLLTGGSLLLAVVLPYALSRAALSPPAVLLGVGALIGLLPISDDLALDPVDQRAVIEHVTELTVIVALMGVGLALDRPFSLRKRGTWGAWHATWRLLAIAMPLSIAGVALLGWWVIGLAPAIGPAARRGARADGPGARLGRPGRGADHRRRRGDRRAGRGALRPHLRGRPQRRPRLPVRVRRHPDRVGRTLRRMGLRVACVESGRQGRRSAWSSAYSSVG